MPDIYGFNHLPNWGAVRVACVEVGCDAQGSLSEWPEEKREEHHKTHAAEINSKKKAAAKLREAQRIAEAGPKVSECRVCHKMFEQLRKRGRPHTECPECRESMTYMQRRKIWESA